MIVMNNDANLQSLMYKAFVKLSSKKILRGRKKKLLAAAQAIDGGFSDPVQQYTGDELQYAVIRHTRFLLVLFPASMLRLNDWVSNADIRKVKFRGGSVHKGFWSHVDSYWPKLLQLFESEPNKSIVFAGHSRGGACAVVAALRFTLSLPEGDARLAAVITIGQPPVVSKNLAVNVLTERWGRRYKRFVSSCGSWSYLFEL